MEPDIAIAPEQKIWYDIEQCHYAYHPLGQKPEIVLRSYQYTYQIPKEVLKGIIITILIQSEKENSPVVWMYGSTHR
jgi:hypothetical protein